MYSCGHFSLRSCQVSHLQLFFSLEMPFQTPFSQGIALQALQPQPAGVPRPSLLPQPSHAFLNLGCPILHERPRPFPQQPVQCSFDPFNSSALWASHPVLKVSNIVENVFMSAHLSRSTDTPSQGNKVAQWETRMIRVGVET